MAQERIRPTADVLNLRNPDSELWRKEGESLSIHKKRLTQLIRETEKGVEQIRKNKEGWENAYKNLSEEAVRKEAQREEVGDHTLPDKEAMLRQARMDAEDARLELDYYEKELLTSEARLQKYIQYREALDGGAQSHLRKLQKEYGQ